MKQKRNQGHIEQTGGYQGEAGGGKMVWKIGVSGFKALYVGYIYIYIYY